MNRQIKFRGKRLDNGEWIYGDLIHIDKSDIGIVTDYDHWQGCRVDPSTVGQFVGIADKSGEDVYEGDIVQYKYWHTERNRWSEYKTVVSQVCWKEHFLTFTLPEANLFLAPAYKDTVMKFDHPSEMEVIGNIYDNPELIKGDDK